MTDIKSDFENEADFDVRRCITHAYALTGPNYEWGTDSSTSQLAIDYVDRIYDHLSSWLERKGSHVFSILSPVASLNDQIATDRARFSVMTDDEQDETQKQINARRDSVRLVLRMLKDHPDLPNEDKLILLHNARTQLYSIAVYTDRLANSAPPKLDKPRIEPQL